MMNEYKDEVVEQYCSSGHPQILLFIKPQECIDRITCSLCNIEIVESRGFYHCSECSEDVCNICNTKKQMIEVKS